jgi:hypothetical protein
MTPNGFELHNIDHLSASSLNTWVAQPALWVMERLLKKSAPVGVAAHRGTAIEHGIERGLFNPELSVAECQALAVREYDRLTALSGDPKKEKERTVIPDSVAIGLEELREYGIPTAPENGRQHKIKADIEGVPVPFIGYIDFLYDQHGLLIDLKTEHRLSSEIKSAHGRQMAIYKSAKGNHEIRVAYVTPKRCGVYRVDEAERSLNEVRRMAASLERFLSLSKDPWDLAALLSPDPESFYWNNNTARANRFEVYGY